ncbi:MAG: hypothetical protein EBU46_09125 [Nitrosomonadaceae bacterium]|nr:hypothetical protein [Nitrosomonadaceae bacterium]
MTEAVHQNPISLDTPGSRLPLTPWNVQSIVYELLSNYMLKNDPEQLGFKFKQKYHIDRTKSDIVLDIGYNWKTTEANKVPACYITRGDVEIKGLTMDKATNVNTITSETSRLLLNTMTLQIACIATNLGFTEQFAEYVKQSFTTFGQEIKREFGFRRFNLSSMSKPTIYLESKEKFVVSLNLDVAFDEGWAVSGNDLKLKSVGRVIFDSVNAAPMLNQ